MPLLSLVASSPEAVRQLTIEQVVATAGDGRLRDGTESQRELREYLRQVTIDALATYADYCLSNAFPKGGQVLQDLVNELGRRLEYDVTNGRYQGTTNAVGFDGIWRDPSGHGLVIEVKTTDAYRLSLDTVARYRDQLLAQDVLAKPCSILIVVGRTDTGELEAQVRGSRHAWDIRLISVDALLNLVRIKESADSQETIAKMRRLLTPLEYTRLDQLVDVVFTTTQDVETAVSAETGKSLESESQEQSESSESVWEFTPSAGHSGDSGTDCCCPWSPTGVQLREEVQGALLGSAAASARGMHGVKALHEPKFGQVLVRISPAVACLPPRGRARLFRTRVHGPGRGVHAASRRHP